MNITDQDVQAYVDGELAPDDAARVEAAIAADVLVAARVERERRLRAQVRGAFDPVLEEPVPSRLRGLLDRAPASSRDADADADAASVVDLRAARAMPPRGRRWRAIAFAVAASVAALALTTWWRMPHGDITVRDGELLAGGGLARGLDDALASAPDAAAPVAVGLTFRDSAGEVCRTFVAGKVGVAGLACRRGGRWHLDATSRIDGAPGGAVRQAASAMPPAIHAAVDARLHGDAFDAAQEREAQANGWR